MSTRSLAVLVTLCALGGCAFDSVFFPVDERPDAQSATNLEDVILTSSDGHRIRHVFVKPDSHPKATIFVLHGSGSKVSNWIGLLTPLVDDGYQLFLLEYRGFAASEGRASHQSVLEDARSAFLYLAGRDDVRDLPLFLLGQSYGAQPAINIAVEFPDRVAGLVTEGAFTSFRDIAVYTTPWYGKPFTWAFFRNPYSASQLISQVSVPTLVIHSQDDVVVPFPMGKELFEQAGGDKEFWTIRGQHTNALIDYPTEFVSKLNRLAGLAEE